MRASGPAPQKAACGLHACGSPRRHQRAIRRRLSAARRPRWLAAELATRSRFFRRLRRPEESGTAAQETSRALLVAGGGRRWEFQWCPFRQEVSRGGREVRRKGRHQPSDLGEKWSREEAEVDGPGTHIGGFPLKTDTWSSEPSSLRTLRGSPATHDRCQGRRCEGRQPRERPEVQNLAKRFCSGVALRALATR